MGVGHGIKAGGILESFEKLLTKIGEGVELGDAVKVGFDVINIHEGFELFDFRVAAVGREDFAGIGFIRKVSIDRNAIEIAEAGIIHAAAKLVVEEGIFGFDG